MLKQLCSSSYFIISSIKLFRARQKNFFQCNTHALRRTQKEEPHAEFRRIVAELCMTVVLISKYLHSLHFSHLLSSSTPCHMHSALCNPSPLYFLFAQLVSPHCARESDQKKKYPPYKKKKKHQGSSERFFLSFSEKSFLLFGLLTTLHIPFQLAWFLTYPL